MGKPDDSSIILAAFINGIRIDQIRVSSEAEIESAKRWLLGYYPDAKIFRKV